MAGRAIIRNPQTGQSLVKAATNLIGSERTRPKNDVVDLRNDWGADVAVTSAKQECQRPDNQAQTIGVIS